MERQSSRAAKMLKLALDKEPDSNKDDITSSLSANSFFELTEQENKSERTVQWILHEEFGFPEVRSNESLSDCITTDGTKKNIQDLQTKNRKSIVSTPDETEPNLQELQAVDIESIVSESYESSVISYVKQIIVKKTDLVNTNEDESNEQTDTNERKIIKNHSLGQLDKSVEVVYGNTKKKKTLCKFCNISVTNFERHLLRHHLQEKQVQDYLSFPKDTKEGRQMRRNILALLRYETNFEQYVNSNENHDDELPCSHCKRIISKRYLRRHYKKCIVKPFNDTGRKVRHLAASQTLVAYAGEYGNTVSTVRVKNEVFNRMACDEIGVVARKDALIRHFGELYLKKHKRAQIFIACSNKMRECSRLLVEMRRRLGKQELTFFQMLDPVLFDDVVLSAKLVSGYDEDNKNYKAPSLAMHLGTTLQKICELSTHLLLKKSPEFMCSDVEDRLKEIKRFRFLVQTQWSNEVSSLALKDLAEKKWNKPVMLPLTKDIIKFKNYIMDNAQKNFDLLNEDNNNIKAFKGLVDASLALTILFNRRRIGDVQYLATESYLNNVTSTEQAEILEQLTDSEKALTTSYKRVVAGGKGSRAIVILFPPDLQKYINLLLEVRQTTSIIPDRNRYLFAYPGVTKQWIRGDVVLKKFATSSGVDNPLAMTSNRLRKQIATLMQVVNLNKDDYSQFAKFMGHTEKTHREYYEITQNAYQTAKVAKLLNLFDRGKGDEYKYTPMDIINLDPNSEVAESDQSDNEDDEEQATAVAINTEDEPFAKKQDQKPKKCNRVRWTQQQKRLVTAYFKNNIKQRRAPRKHECDKLIKEHKDLLSNLDWVRIKTFIFNVYNQAKEV